MKHIRITALCVVLTVCAGIASAQTVNPEETKFLQEMDQYFHMGEDFSEIALPEIANFYYSQAVVGVNALDKAVTAIYWTHKLEADKAADQAETDEIKEDLDFWGIEGLGGLLDLANALNKKAEEWSETADKIADELGLPNFKFDDKYWVILQGESVVSPYPEFFNGLVADYEGRAKEADEHYRRAFANPYMMIIYDFSYLAKLSQDELQAMSERLKAKAAEYGANFTWRNTKAGDTSRNWDPRWHLEQAQKCLKGGSADYALAELHCRNAVRAYPFDVSLYIAGAEVAIKANNYKQTVYYINNGLLIDPDNATLHKLVDGINAAKKN